MEDNDDNLKDDDDDDDDDYDAEIASKTPSGLGLPAT